MRNRNYNRGNQPEFPEISFKENSKLRKRSLGIEKNNDNDSWELWGIIESDSGGKYCKIASFENFRNAAIFRDIFNF